MSGDGQGWLEMAEDGSKWPETTGAEMAGNGQGWLEMSGDSRGWPGMAGNGRNWLGMVGNGRGWPGMAGDGQGWSKMDWVDRGCRERCSTLRGHPRSSVEVGDYKRKARKRFAILLS